MPRHGTDPWHSTHTQSQLLLVSVKTGQTGTEQATVNTVPGNDALAEVKPVESGQRQMKRWWNGDWIS